MSTENLGPPVTWTIRDVPTMIRDKVVDATPRGAKVADTLTQLVLRGLHGSNESHASDKISNVSDSDLAALMTAAATLANSEAPENVKKEGAATVRARFRAARGISPPPPRPRKIAAAPEPKLITAETIEGPASPAEGTE